MWHTSLYLDEAERAIVSSLSGGLGSVDVFEEPLAGLLMLEVDLGDRERLDAFEPPEWAGEEVTFDESFTGCSLARLDCDQLRAAI